MAVRADPLPDPEPSAHRLGKVLREQAGSIADADHQLAALRAELATARALAAEYVATAATAQAERDRAVQYAHDLRDAAVELEALRQTKLVRWSAVPRRLYGRVRAILRTGRSG
jgi:hypothetical protein